MTVWAVVLVKEIWCFTRVMRPPPPSKGLSCLSVVYPGNLSVFSFLDDCGVYVVFM